MKISQTMAKTGGKAKTVATRKKSEVIHANGGNACGTKHVKKDVLSTAREIIYGDREQTYGSPGFNLKSIADLWTVYLRRSNPAVVINDLKATDVAQLMILLKTARLINSPGHIDSLVDQCGYAALHERIL